MGQLQKVNENIDSGEFLYRYLSAKHLLDLLSNEKLYLARSDRFTSDRFEAILPQELVNIMSMINNGEFYYEVTNKSFSEVEKNDTERKSEKIIEETRSSLRKNQKETYITCWDNANHESATLWDRCPSESTVALRIEKKISRKNYHQFK